MATRVPSLNWLRVFEAAARTESFAQASNQLNLSAAAVSQQVKALETQLGTPLFRRHAHAVTLTDAGRAYLPAVQQSLLMLDAATAGLFGATRAERLYVQADLLFAQGLLAPALPDFQARHPTISTALNTGVAPSDFGTQFADLQIVFGNPRNIQAESDPLNGETLYPVALPDLAAQISGPEDLLRFPLIEVAPHRSGWPHLFQALGLIPTSARHVFVDTTLVAATLAASGGGIALARAPASDLVMQALGLRPCLPEVSVPGQERYHLVYGDLQSMRKPASVFRTWLLDQFPSAG